MPIRHAAILDVEQILADRHRDLARLCIRIADAEVAALEHADSPERTPSIHSVISETTVPGQLSCKRTLLCGQGVEQQLDSGWLRLVGAVPAIVGLLT